MYNMNMHLLNCNKTDAEYLHVKFSKVFLFACIFFTCCWVACHPAVDDLCVLSQEGGASSDSVNTDPC